MQIVRTNDLYAKAAEIPVISPAVIELINIVGEPDTTNSQIVAVVGTDTVLCSSIFKFANSATLAARRKVRSLEEAVYLLGLNELKILSFLTAAKRIVLDADLWYKSVFTAHAARKIAKELGKNTKYQEDIYLAGLMHTIGLLVFKLYYHNEYKEINQETDKYKRLKLEKELFGTDHLALAHHILKTSDLPESVIEIIRNQSKSNSKNKNEENIILDLVNIFEENHMIEDDDLESVIDFKALQESGIRDLKIDSELINKLHEETKELMCF